MKPDLYPYILLLLVGLILLFGCTASASETKNPVAPVSKPETVKEFEVTANNFSFEPATITVNKGDTVLLKITSLDVNHGFAISKFGVSEFIGAGKTVTVEFVASESGSYPFYCSVYCGSGHGEMKGALIVK